jgi:hypothetical protein
VSERRDSEVLDVLRVVPPTPHVLASGEVAEPKEWLPRDRHHAPPPTDTRQFFHGELGISEVLENLETGDDVRALIGEREHSGISSNSAGGGQALESRDELVASILDPDERAGTNLHRFQCKSLSDPDIDPSPFG